MTSYYDIELDTSGLKCPLPLLKTKQCLKNLDVGQIVRVISTDASSVLDFKVFTATSGHTLVDYQHINNDFIFLIRKST